MSEPGASGSNNSGVEPVETAIPPRFRKAVSITLWALAAAIAAIFYWRATQSGIGLIGDTVDYVATARNILAGEGARTLDGRGGTTPLTQFPPMYPLLLALAARMAHRDVLKIARVLHLVLHVAAVLLTGAVGWRAARSALCGGIVATLMAVTTPLLLADIYVMSEPLFLCAVFASLLSLDAALSRRSWQWAALAGLFVTFAELTRYAGQALFPVAIIGLLLRGRNWRERIACAASFSLIACAGPIGWMLRNYHVAHKATGRMFVWHPPAAADFREGLSTIGQWLLPPIPLFSEFFGTAILLLMLLLLSQAGKKWRDETAGHCLSAVAALYGFSHLIFLIASRTFVDANIRLRDRHLTPVFPIFIVVAVAAAYTLSRQWRAGRWILISLGAAVVIAGGSQTLVKAEHAGDVGEGYANRKKWQQSGTMKLIASAPRGQLIYTDSYDAVYLLTGRNVWQLPKARFGSTGGDNPAIDLDVSQMLETLRVSDGWIVYFNQQNRSNLLSEESLGHAARIIPLNGRQPSDGRVYRLESR